MPQKPTNRNGTPAYQRIQSVIRKRIESGQLRTGDSVASERGEPLMRIRQLIYSSKGKAITYVLGFYRSDRHKLLIRRFR